MGVEGGRRADLEVAGRGRSISISRTIRPGRGEITTTLSASCTASSMLWVTKTTVLPVCSHRRSRSARSCSRSHGVEGTEGLVHQHQRRIVDQGATEGGALLHAAGELVGPPAGEPFEADGAEELAGTLQIGRALQATQVDLQEHVAEHVAPVDQDVALEDDADVGLRAGDFAGQRSGSRPSRRTTARRSSRAGCSAAARRPQQSHERATFDPQIERAEGVNGVASVAEGLGRTEDVDGDGHPKLTRRRDELVGVEGRSRWLVLTPCTS